jgi:hypothetical protein
MRVPALLTVLLGLLSLTSCGGNNPACNECPDLAGSWSLAWDPGEDPPACVEQGATLPEGAMALTQVGSAVRGTLAGVELQGTVFESWDFNLNGSEERDEAAVLHSVGGRFVAGQPALETVDRLLGTYTATHPQGCVLSRGYVATRTP